MLELGLVFGARQPGVADVVARVEVGVVGPHRPALVERHVCEPLAVARYQVQAALHVGHELLGRRRLALEDHHRRDVHMRGGVVLQVQEGRVQRRQAVGVGHTPTSRRSSRDLESFFKMPSGSETRQIDLVAGNTWFLACVTCNTL